MKPTQPQPAPLLDPPPVDPNVVPEDESRLAGQNAKVLGWLQNGERVTVRRAWGDGVQWLAARIHDLRAAGYAINGDYLGGEMTYFIPKPGVPIRKR